MQHNARTKFRSRKGQTCKSVCAALFNLQMVLQSHSRLPSIWDKKYFSFQSSNFWCVEHPEDPQKRITRCFLMVWDQTLKGSWESSASCDSKLLASSRDGKIAKTRVYLNSCCLKSLQKLEENLLWIFSPYFNCLEKKKTGSEKGHSRFWISEDVELMYIH